MAGEVGLSEGRRARHPQRAFSPLFFVALFLVVFFLALLPSPAAATDGSPLRDGGTYPPDATILVAVPMSVLPTDTLLITTPSSVYRYKNPVAGTTVPFNPIEEGAYQLSLLHADGSAQDLASFMVSGNVSVGTSQEQGSPPYGTAPNPPAPGASGTAEEAAALILPKQAYLVGEPVAIGIAPLPHDRSRFRVEIRHGDAIYVSQGSLAGDAQFLPSAPGTYVLSLIEDGTVLDEATIDVVAAPAGAASAPNGSAVPAGPVMPSSPASVPVAPAAASPAVGAGAPIVQELGRYPSVQPGEAPSSLPPGQRLFPGRARPVAPAAAGTLTGEEKRSSDEAKRSSLLHVPRSAAVRSFAADERVTLSFSPQDATVGTRLADAFAARSVAQQVLPSLAAGPQALVSPPATLGLEGKPTLSAVSDGTLPRSNLTVTLADAQGNRLATPLAITRDNATSYTVSFTGARAFRPGLYRLAFQDPSTGAVEERWFAYGLVSVNTEHPVYHPGENARLTVVVLDGGGFPVAGAAVSLTIVSPAGARTTLSTAAGTVVPTAKRGVYEAAYDIPEDEEGNYSILASAAPEGIAVNVSTSFLVAGSFPYDIVRDVPATVDPDQGPFRNAFMVMPLDGAPATFAFTEYLPSSFIITNTTADDIRYVNGTYVLTWLNASTDTDLSYEAQPPLLSPYLYELGRAEVTYTDPASGAFATFQEARPWLFAIDPAALSCSSSPCDTGTSINGRDTMSGGAEPNQPNTIDSCTDGTSGTYHSDESLDRMVIADLNHTVFTAGDTVQVNLTVWCWGTADNLNWVYTNDSVTPAWRVLSSTTCPSGGSLQTFTYSFPLDDTSGNHTIRGVFQYTGSAGATCGAGSYDDNDDVTLVVQARDTEPPSNLDVSVNRTVLPVNGSVKVLAEVTDNVGVAGVNATVRSPGGSFTNLTLSLANLSIPTSTGDLESGTIAYAAASTPPGTASVQENTIAFSTAQSSQDIAISPVNTSRAFLLVDSTAASSTPDIFTFTGRFLNSTAIRLERAGTGTAATASYYVIEASDISVTNGSTTFATGDSTIDVAIPDQGASYATKTFVTLSTRSDATSTTYVAQGYVTGELTNRTNLRLTRDASGNAGLTVEWSVIRFLDGTTVQTGETSVTTTGSATLSSVATNRTWLSFTTRMDTNGLSRTSIRGNLASSTQAGFSRVSGTGSSEARWFAIQFPDGQGAWAEQGLQAGSSGEATANIAIAAVNTSRSFSSVTEDSTGNGNAYPRPYWTEQLTSSTNIQATRGYTGQTSNHDWQALTWPVDPGTQDTEANKSFTPYSDVSSTDYSSLSSIAVSVTVSAYSDAGSQQRGNGAADLEAQLYNGSDWISIGLLNVTGTGNYEIATTDAGILSAWLAAANRDIRLRAVDMDYYDASHADTIDYTAVDVTLDGNMTRYAADWNATSQAGPYNVTDLWSQDVNGNTNHTTYSAVSFLVLNYGAPAITVLNVENDTTETYSFTNQTPSVNATVDTNATCYLSTADETYAQMVANGRVSCGSYTMNVPKECVYAQTLPVGSVTLHMACNNSFSGVTNDAADNKDFGVDVLCDSHADCAANQYCDYTQHCHADVPDGYECKEATFDGQPSDAVCGGGSDPGTCVNDSSYSFTGWYCAKNASNCVFNDSGHTYDEGYALCNALAGPNDYRSCAASQLWSPVVDCGDLNEGADQDATASAHTGDNCSYYASAQTCVSGDPGLGSYGCTGAATDCGAYVYLGSGLCGNTLADCDAGCGAQCDADNSTVAAIAGGTCYYGKSCSNTCAWSQSQELAPDFCINDNNGGPCALANRTDPSAAGTCYWNATCQDVAGASLTQGAADNLRQDYCDYCTASGNVSGAYSPAPNASCSSNCSDSGTLYYDTGGTPLSRADDCDGTGGTTIMTDTLTYGDIWNGSGPATCDDAECDLDVGPYLNGSCAGGPTGMCTFSDPDPPELTIVSPGNGTWFKSSPAVFQYSVLDLGSGVANCSLIVDGAIVNTTVAPAEDTTLNFTYSPGLGSFTWSLECYDDSAQANKASSGTLDSGYDDTLPVLSNPARNGTLFDINQYVCLNLTVTDTYSGVSQVRAELDLPPPYGITNITLSPGVTACNPSGAADVYSAEYQLVFSGPFNWTNAYAKDLAGNWNSLAVGLNWSVSAAGFLEGTLLAPTTDVTINESGANDNLTMSCKARCTDQGIACANVSLAVQYDLGKGAGDWAAVNTTGENLTSNASSHFCGDLNVSEPGWWNGSFAYRRRLNITTPGTIEQGYTVNLTLDTTGAKFLASGDDLRVLYWDGSSWTELDRINATPFGSATTEIRFRTQASITTQSTAYYLYYGDPSATGPPANPVNVYFFYDDFSDGDIAGWQNFSSGVVTYASLSGNGVIEKTTNNDPSGGTGVFSRNITGYRAEFDFDRPDESGGAQTRYAISDATDAGYGFRVTDVNPSGNFQIEERSSGGASAGNLATVATSYFSLNTWFHVVQWYEGGTINISVYNETSGALLGSLQASDGSVTQFDRFNIHGGYDFYTDNIKVWLYDSADAPSVALLSEKNASEIADQPGTSCNASFLIASAGDLSGNNTWPLRCEAYADNAPTTFSSAVNVTVNDHPVATVSAPGNGTWQHGTITVNGSASFDSDGSIANYLFQYDNTTAFSSPTTICSGASAACSWNTTAQDQCLNDTKSCWLQLVVTDDRGLASASAPVLLGFDVTGPVTVLDRPAQGANITTDTYMVNASVTDGQVGTLSQVLFEYRENSSASWKSACNDTDGASPFQCVWNTSALPDGSSYQVRAYANDTFGNIGSASTHTGITLDRTPPVVMSLSPGNTTYSLGNETLTYNVTDATSSVANCTLYLDGSPADTTVAPAQNTTLNFTVTDLPEGTRTWRVDCTDALGNTGSGGNRTIIVDLTGPVVTLDRPPTAGSAYGLFTVNATATDAGVGNISAVTFRYRENSTAIWQDACTDTDGASPFQCAWNTTGLPDGSSYQVRAYANDTLGNTGAASTHTAITVDNNGPVIDGLLPADGATDTDGNVTIRYRVSDAGSAVANCSLSVNGTLNQTTTGPAEGTYLYFSLSYANDTTLTWSITCWDAFAAQPHSTATASRSLTINILYLLNAAVTTDKTAYQVGNQAGEDANITTNTTDAVNASLDAAAQTDLILTNGSSLDPWWNTSWAYRTRATLAETESIDRTDQWVSLPFTPDPDCAGLAHVNSLRLVRDGNVSLPFDEWNVTYCPDATHVKSLWVTFRLNLTASGSADISLYYDPGSGFTQAATDRGPMRLVWVSSGGSGNPPDTTTLKSDIGTALGNMGLASSGFYDELSTSAGSSDFTLSDLQDYPIVLYDSAAKYGSSWTSAEATALWQYLNQSGDVMVAGQDLGYDANQGGWIYNGAWQALTRTSAGWVDNANPSTFTVNAAHPVTQHIGAPGTTVSVTGDYEDGFTTLTGSPSVQLLNWTGSGTPIAATASDGLFDTGCTGFCGKTVYYAGLLYISTSQGIQSAAARQALFQGALEWFLTNRSLSVSYGQREKWIARNSTSSTGSDGRWSWIRNVEDLALGRYVALTLATKTKYNDAVASGAFNVTADATPPDVSLISPENASEENSSVTFSYSVNDTLSTVANCSVSVDGAPSGSPDTTIQEGIPQFFYPYIPGVGWHNWTVCCYDAYANLGCADNRTVYIKPPDLVAELSDVAINPAAPYHEGENLTLNITIWNRGGSDTATNFTVQLWDGDPGAGGAQIGTNYSINLTDQYGNRSNETLSWDWTVARPGTSTLYLVIDPPLATNGTILELNESNNELAFNVTTSGYTVIYGSVVSTLLLDSAGNKTLLSKSGETNNTGLIFFTDSESSVNFGSLQALGRTIANTSGTTDFTDADALLNMTGFNDSVNDVWAQGNDTPSATATFTVDNNAIPNVPVVDSSASGAFRTGILWDESKDTGDGQYDTSDKEPLVFFTEINSSQPGDYGTYDYQGKVPALLRDYAGSGGTTIYLYYELT